MTNSKNVPGSTTQPQVSFNELISMLNSVSLDTNRRLLATNLITAFVAAADAASAMSAAAVAASEAATAILNMAEPLGNDQDGSDGDMPELMTPSPDSEPEESDGFFNIITGGPPSGIVTVDGPGHSVTATSEVDASLGADGPPAAATSSEVDAPGNAEASSSGGFSQASAASHPWYTVTVGRRVGIFPHWSVVSPLVTGVSNACYAKHASKAAAQAVFRMAASANAVRIVPDVAALLEEVDEV